MVTLPIHHDCKAVSKQDPVRSIEGWLQGQTKTRPVVLDGKVPYGLPDTRTLMNHKYDITSKLDKHTRPVQVLSVRDDPEDAMVKMSEEFADYLPVRSDDHDKLAGCVDALDLLDAFDEGPDAAAAARWVVPLKTSQDMGDALRRFANEPIHWLPVIDAEGRIAGVLHTAEVLGFVKGSRQRAGRQDFSGEKTALKNNTIDGYMTPGWNEVRLEADFVETRDLLRKAGYVFVAEDARPRDGKVGVITPAVLIRRLHATRTESTSWSPVHPGIPRRTHAPDHGREMS